MIYTVTMNPSVDFISKLDAFQTGRSNDAEEDRMAAGGRALNVSRLLKTIDVPTTATGFVGGRTGEFIEDELDRLGILHDFIRTQSETRLNVSLFIDQVETRIISPGGRVSLDEVNDLMYYLSRVREGDFMVIAGSLPRNLSSEVYARMVDIAVVNGASFLPIIDPEYLKPLIERKPLLITPTRAELASLCNHEVLTKEDAAPLAIDLVRQGAQNVIVNFGQEGCLYVDTELHVFESSGPVHPIVSSTYSNMALIAGFIGNYMRTGDPKEAFRAGQGTLNAACYVEGLPDVEKIHEAYEEVSVMPLA